MHDFAAGAREKIATRLAEQELALVHRREYGARCLDIINEAVAGYVKTGLALMTPAFVSAFTGWELEPERYFRNIAERMDRPFVFGATMTGRDVSGAWQAWQKVFFHLRMPKVPRLTQLAAALLLVSQEHDDAVGAVKSDGPVTHYHSPKIIHFYFQGQDGQTVLDSFVEQCRTNPVFRVMLKV